MSKRHTLGISKWLPSTEDKITFEITLRPSTPDISKHLCICVYVFHRPSSNHKRSKPNLVEVAMHLYLIIGSVVTNNPTFPY